MNSPNLEDLSGRDLTGRLSIETTSSANRDHIMRIFAANPMKRQEVPSTTWYYIYRVSPDKWEGRSKVMEYARLAEKKELQLAPEVEVLAVA